MPFKGKRVLFRRLDRNLEDLPEEVAREMQRRARRRSPVRTGRFRRGWAIRRVRYTLVRLINPVPYARYVEEGTLYVRGRYIAERIAGESEEIVRKVIRKLRRR